MLGRCPIKWWQRLDIPKAVDVALLQVHAHAIYRDFFMKQKFKILSEKNVVFFIIYIFSLKTHIVGTR